MKHQMWYLCKIVKNKLTNEVGWIIMWCYRHTDVTKEIYYFIDVTKICSLLNIINIQYQNCKNIMLFKQYFIYLSITD